MKSYEHKILEVNPEGLRFQIKGLGPTWRFAGTVEPNSTVWVREVPAPGLGAILSEISVQLHSRALKPCRPRSRASRSRWRM